VLIIDPDHADSKNKIRLLIKKLKNKENYLSEKYYSNNFQVIIEEKLSQRIKKMINKIFSENIFYINKSTSPLKFV